MCVIDNAMLPRRLKSSTCLTSSVDMRWVWLCPYIRVCCVRYSVVPYNVKSEAEEGIEHRTYKNDSTIRWRHSDSWFVWKPNDSLRKHTTSRTTHLVTIEDVCAWRQNLLRLAFVVRVFGSSSAWTMWPPVPCEIYDSHRGVDGGQSSSSDWFRRWSTGKVIWR